MSMGETSEHGGPIEPLLFDELNGEICGPRIPEDPPYQFLEMLNMESISSGKHQLEMGSISSRSMDLNIRVWDQYLSKKHEIEISCF